MPIFAIMDEVKISAEKLAYIVKCRDEAYERVKELEERLSQVDEVVLKRYSRDEAEKLFIKVVALFFEKFGFEVDHRWGLSTLFKVQSEDWQEYSKQVQIIIRDMQITEYENQTVKRMVFDYINKTID